MLRHAKSSFKNVVSNHSVYDEAAKGPALARITHEREFQGELQGKSRAELQACMTDNDRFGYVGTDRFSGELHHRQGTFVFQHGGVRESGKLRSFGFIVPGSGTGELTGIRGDIEISVTPEGQHLVSLSFELEPT